MTLRERIKEIAARKINPEFARAFSVVVCVRTLCERAFVERWPEGRDTQNIREAALLLEQETGISEQWELD